MSVPSGVPVNPEIKFCPELRDKIFEYLPAQARITLMGVEVKYWPNNHGEMELHLKYYPTDGMLDLDATEGIYGPDKTLTGSLVRGCEIDSETGQVHAYVEHMVSKGTTNPIGYHLVRAEQDVNTFDATKLEFLMRLFDSL